MRHYKCVHRRMGTYETKARHAFEAQRQAAEYWQCDIGNVLVTLEDVTPAGYRT